MAKTREQRIREGTLVPNSFQYPNLYVDWVSFYLTPEEEKVLNKAVREILGWDDKIADRRARIALSIFVNGKASRKTGETTCLGCGLGLQASRKALAALDEYGILVKEGAPTQDGQEFRLQDNVNKIDWDGLAARRETWDQKNTGRTQPATLASLTSRGITSGVRGNVARYPNPLSLTSDVTPGVTSDVVAGVTSDVMAGVTSDVNKETQIETKKEETQIETQRVPFQEWHLVLAALKGTMAKETFDAHLLGSTATRNDGMITVTVRRKLSLPWCERLRPMVAAALTQATGYELALAFTTEEVA